MSDKTKNTAATLSYGELLEKEHQRVEKIISSFETKDMPKVWYHLVQASNSLRSAASAAREYENNERDDQDEG
jgi:ribosomal protein S12